MNVAANVLLVSDRDATAAVMGFAGQRRTCDAYRTKSAAVSVFNPVS